MPALDLGTKPEHRSAATEVDHRPWHVWVARLVLADRVPVSKTQDLGNVVGVDQVVDEDSSGHKNSLRR